MVRFASCSWSVTARDQTQLDVYGALLDSVYLYNKYGAAISYEGWRHVTRTVDYVVEHWREADHGIWEFRNGTRPLLHFRWIGTLDAIGRELRVDPLIFRYTRGSTLDGLPGMEGGFSACSARSGTLKP